eukprot:5857954-Pleurochrysis_carterae.AAC.3
MRVGAKACKALRFVARSCGALLWRASSSRLRNEEGAQHGAPAESGGARRQLTDHLDVPDLKQLPKRELEHHL